MLATRRRSRLANLPCPFFPINVGSFPGVLYTAAIISGLCIRYPGKDFFMCFQQTVLDIRHGHDLCAALPQMQKQEHWSLRSGWREPFCFFLVSSERGEAGFSSTFSWSFRFRQGRKELRHMSQE